MRLINKIKITIKKIKNPIFFGNLRRLKPVSNVYGFDRGTPIDRYYIENFLEKNSLNIRGTVLEILNAKYTKKFGRTKVKKSDILDIEKSNKKANIHADLRKIKQLPSNKYDCIIFTQVLHIIDDYRAVIKNLHKMLKPGGILLCTLPSVSRIDCVAKEEGDYWRFTKASAKYIFKKHFKEKKLEIRSFGNVFVDICFLEGVSLEEMKPKELDYYDKNFPLIVCVRAVK